MLGVLGKTVEMSVVDGNDDNNINSSFSIEGFCKNPPCNILLQIISTPYREGSHSAKNPINYLPIIDQLEKLHAQNFVHGDIRAYNIVFGDRDASGTPPQGWLIDFDLGGEAGKVFYPPGYNDVLDDGQRCGRPGQPIEKWHDWWALGHLIFHVQGFVPPSNSTLLLESKEYVKLLSLHNDLDIKWKNLAGNEDIENGQYVPELKDFLKNMEAFGWKLWRSGFKDESIED